MKRREWKQTASKSCVPRLQIQSILGDITLLRLEDH